MLSPLSWMVLLLTVACTNQRKATPQAAETLNAVTPTSLVDFSKEAPVGVGLEVVLSDGLPPGGRAERTPVAAATPLSLAETQALLARLPPIEGQVGDQVAFSVRERSLPPPKVGTVRDLSFPPSSSGAVPPEVEAGPLTVVRASPEGEVPIAPPLSVTFSQPMVALGTATETNAQVPLRLEPEPPGQWRWIGTQTLLFEPEGQFPKATEYTVTTREGVASVTGAPLAEPLTLRFSTPPLRLVQQWPQGDSVPLEPDVLLVFDQRIDPDRLAGSLQILAGSVATPWRRSTPEEIAANADIARMLREVRPERAVVIRPQAPLPGDAHISVVVAAGAPSAEGPRLTPNKQQFGFDTYGPLTVVKTECGWRDRCEVWDSISFSLSNALQGASFETTQVEISPALPDASIYSWGEQLRIDGQKLPHTTYTVTLSPDLTDIFGQKIAGKRSFTFKTGAMERPEPYLQGFPGELLVLDPSGGGTLPVLTTAMSQVDVRIYRVQPEDWGAWGEWRQMLYERGASKAPPGELVRRLTLAVAEDPHGAQVETLLDLSPDLTDGLGQLVVWAQPMRQPGRVWEQQHAFAWVQGTRLAVVAAVDMTEVVGWVTSLADGTSVPDASLALLGSTGAEVQTDAGGLARLALPEEGEERPLLVARRGADVAILPEQAESWSSQLWVRRDPGVGMVWYVADDRQMYRPGETVYLKGWLRALDHREGGDTGAVPLPPGTRLSWSANDLYGNELRSGVVDITSAGGFHVDFVLPETVNLGPVNISLSIPDQGEIFNESWGHAIQVQEFRRPEFEVTVSADGGPHILGERSLATVVGAYYAGGGLPGAEVRWTVQSSPATFTPPNQEEGYQFGPWLPWWRVYSHHDYDGEGWQGGSSAPSGWVEHTATTDAAGEHLLGMHFRSMATPRPMQVSASAAVTDVNRQTWSGGTSLLVHPSASYVGVRPSESFYDKGEDVTIDLIAVDLEGARVPDQALTLSAVRTEWRRKKDGSWAEEEVERHDCAVRSTSAAAAAASCRFRPEAGGSFALLARVVDAEGRPNETHATVWVSGAEAAAPRTVSQQAVTLVPDKDRYAPGDVAEVLIQSPIAPAEALISWRRSGVVHTERRRLESATTVIEVPIEDRHVPNLTVQVSVVGTAKRADAEGERADLADRPAYGAGEIDLPVSTLQRTLKVDVLPSQAEVLPGKEVGLTIRVTDAAGKPVSGAEVAVIAVDESVLSLTGYQVADPIGVFYPSRPPMTSDHFLHQWLMLADPEAVPPADPSTGMGLMGDGEGGGGLGRRGGREEERSAVLQSAAPGGMIAEAPPPAAPSTRARNAEPKADKDRLDDADNFAILGASAESGSSGAVIAVRSDFQATAMFVPAALTGGDGVAALTLKLPDNLTRYRITAVAVSGERRFGKGEASVTARLPLMVRPSPPRFLNFGDTFELPVVVQNQTDAPMTVSLAVRAHNLRVGSGDAGEGVSGKRVQVAARDRVEVRFPASAEEAGTARVQLAVSAGDFADAAAVSLPVRTPATSESVATYGVIDGLGERGEAVAAIQQPLSVPQDVWPQFGGLEISTSTTAVGSLTDAVLYLVDYPYGCAEQIGSRVLAVTALRDVLAAFDAEGLPDAAALKASVEADLEELGRRQNGDGGFGFWRRGESSWPYVSLHVAHALVRARLKGFAVSDATYDPSMRYLRNIRSHVPREYGERTRQTLEAYALYIRHLGGDTDGADAARLYKAVGADGDRLELLGWLLPVLHAGGHDGAVTEIHALLDNRVSETAAAAHFVTAYGEEDYLLLHASRRTDGILLDAMIRTRPRNTLIPKLVEGLLGSRDRSGRWASTQDNVFVLLAMDSYFNTFEAVEPDLVAQAWLGERFVGEQAFKGRSVDSARIHAPMAWLQETGGGDIVLANRGAGRLYYRLGMDYAPRSLDLEPREAGFSVERRYEAVDDPADVQRTAEGAWQVRAGARVRVRLTMVAPGRRTHVALVDPLPAGLEVLNPELAVTEELPPDTRAEAEQLRQSGGRGWWQWWGPWYNHENLRDDRVEAFTPLLYGGVYEYSYVTRATTPGTFVVPPTKAEEMYHPETFGRTGTDRLTVVE